MNDLFSVEGKVALVTGGSRGIGAMIARGFVSNGAKTYITSRKAEELQATADVLSELGDCIAIPSDLSTLDGIRALVDQLRLRESAVNILVNNAGATWGERFDDFPESGWDKVMDLNAKSPFFITQQLLPELRAGGDQENPARVINISSINAYVNPKMSNYSYSASKAALVHMTRHLAADLVADHINVNGIAPGYFPSKMTAHFGEMNDDTIKGAFPRGRAGNTEDAAGTAIFLCSRASAWVTGQTIVLDGGVLASVG